MRFFLLAIGMVSISGCASSPWNDGVESSEVARQLAGTPNFDWRLSGDRRVAPLQVFDDGRDVWLQFAPGQAIPAIFSGRGMGARAVPYRRHPPYVVVAGEWAGLVFQGGSLRAFADRLVADTGSAQGTPMASTAPASSSLSAAGHAALAHRPLMDRGVEINPVAAGTPSAGGVPARQADPLPPARSLPAVDHPPVKVPPNRAAEVARVDAQFRIGPEDVTLRGGLARWARQAGWTFDPQHWAVDVDIPVAGTAVFEDDFKDAVRALLASTELAERPVQPCFYSNRVLRVVPHARACGPRRDAGAAA